MRKYCIVIILFFFPQKGFPEIYWYVGAAFIKPAHSIVKIYRKDKVFIIPGGSNNLLKKIIFSKKGDIFMPGGKIYENLIKEKGLLEKSIDFVKQSPVFAISKNYEKKVNNFYDLLNQNITIAFANRNTMALGYIYSKIEKVMPATIRKALKKKKVVEGVNVAQIVNYLKMNIVDSGILFESVAKINNFKVIKIPKKFRIDDIAPLIMLKTYQNYKKSLDFFNFILKHKKIFKKYGYATL